jgi:hypothetical protein
VKRFSIDNGVINGRFVARWLISALCFFCAASVGAENLRIAYTSIAVVYGPLWLTKEAGLFKKYNIDPEFVYIAGGPPQRFVESRFVRELVNSGFVDSLYKSR